MNNLEMRGVLFFSDKHPQVSGYIVIGGEHFEIAGWKPSPVRAEITAHKVRDADHASGSGTSARECDPA